MSPSFGLWRAHLGFATENTYGTAVTAPTIYIPALSYDTYDDDQGIVLDEAPRGVPSKVLQAYQGVRQGKWGATFPYYPNECARFWPKMMGTDSVATSSNQGWQHTFLTNSSGNPNSDTVFVFTGSTEAEWRFAGIAYTALDFKFARATGMATAKVSGIGFAPTTGVTEQTPVYPGVSTGVGWNAPLRGWQATFSIGGSTKVTLLDYEINITREAELIFAGNNSRNPAAVEYGALDAKGKLSLYASTELPYDNYRALTQGALDIVLADSAPGSTQNTLEILLSKATFTKVTPVMSGKYLTWDVEFQAVHNSSVGGDSGPLQIFTTISSSAASTA